MSDAIRLTAIVLVALLSCCAGAAEDQPVTEQQVPRLIFSDSEWNAWVAGSAGDGRSEQAVELGLRWLAKQQQPDGSWRFDSSGPFAAARRSTTGATGLALMPFVVARMRYGSWDPRVRAWSVNMDHPNEKIIRSGMDYLVKRMKVGPKGGDLGEGSMAGHAFATAALDYSYASAYDRDESLKEKFREPLQRAVDFIVATQGEDGSWRDRAGLLDDAGCTAWQLKAVYWGRFAYAKVPPATLQRGIKFLEGIHTTKPRAPGVTAADQRAWTAAAGGLLARRLTGWRADSPQMIAGIEKLTALDPAIGDLQMRHFAAQVIYHQGADEWSRWFPAVRERLVATQVKSGQDAGSWPEDPGAKGRGRLYTTAMNLLTLQTYYSLRLRDPERRDPFPK